MINAPNPLAVLELTPELVRLLRGNTAHLVKVAEAHARYMLFHTHPDRVAGGAERSQQINDALAAVRQPHERDAALRAFLEPRDPDRDLLAQELRETRKTLQREQEAATSGLRRREGEVDTLERRTLAYAERLAAWTNSALRPPDVMEVRNGDVRKIESLRHVLIVAEGREGKLDGFLCGTGRKVYRRVQLPADPKPDFKEGIEAFEDPKQRVTVLGSYVGERNAVFGRLTVPREPKDVFELALAVAPFLEIGRPLVLLEQQRREQPVCVVYGALRELRRGSIVQIEKFVWYPPSPTVRRTHTRAPQ